MADLFFISDTHFGHSNIIQYGQRPFSCVEEMDEVMVKRWNDVVSASAHIYHLGDITMARDGQGKGLDILRRLNGHKRLIMGNHDQFKVKHYLDHFEKVMAMNVIDGMRFTHIPVHPENLGNVFANVHGHIHQAASPVPILKRHVTKDGHVKERWIPYINVSVEVIDYKPVSLDEIKGMVKEAIMPTAIIQAKLKKETR